MTFFEDLTGRFGEIHAELIHAIDGLPAEALDWLPGGEMNSLSVLVVHLVGAEKYWIGAVALGEPTDRVREQEFSVQGLGLEELKKRILDANVYICQALTRFSPADLETSRKSPRNEKVFSVGYCLLHALEHSALHLGHIQITRQLWDQRGI